MQGGGGMVEGGGIQAGNERERAAVWEIGESVRVSISTYCNAILFKPKSVLNHILNNVMFDRLESELDLLCYCNAILFKLSQFWTA